ncbi:MAG: prefoldin subunit [Candidatus Nanoarchaeia archaeon]|nr:prefoldin subunit [Candidatus Nanoarchaeia archaeon]
MEDDKIIETMQNNESILNNINFQIQNFEKELMEMELVLKDLNEKNEGFKIIGSIIIKKDSSSLVEELNEKKEILISRINSLKKKYQQIKEDQEELQSNLK